MRDDAAPRSPHPSPRRRLLPLSFRLRLSPGHHSPTPPPPSHPTGRMPLPARFPHLTHSKEENASRARAHFAPSASARTLHSRLPCPTHPRFPPTPGLAAAPTAAALRWARAGTGCRDRDPAGSLGSAPRDGAMPHQTAGGTPADDVKGVCVCVCVCVCVYVYSWLRRSASCGHGGPSRPPDPSREGAPGRLLAGD